MASIFLDKAPRASWLALLRVSIGSLLLAGACSDDPAAAPPPADPCPLKIAPEAEIPVPAIHTPRWAFEPWISKDISTGADTRDFVKGFRDRDIPIGAVVLDSPWETSYNSFTPNPTRYPNFQGMVDDLHKDNLRIVLWITPLVNSSSFDLETGGDAYSGPAPAYNDGQACSFFINNGDGYGWWKGVGAAVDFFNPKAMAWWHKQQDQVLDAGIDGWKLDFGESYITADPVDTAAGPVPLQTYSEAYYKDFLSYGVHKRGADFLTMVRAYDKSYSFEGRFFARPEHAPVAWMGDNRRDWVGIADALDEMLRSANAGYAVVGSDLGGYLDHDDKQLLGAPIPLDPTVFARWTSLAALTPFMQLHGRANITPWTVPQTNDEIVTIYRYWSKLHHELVPFFASLTEEAYAGAKMPVRPVGAEAAWPGDYRFSLGDAFLVAPVLDATGKRDVELPAGQNFYDWWDAAKDALPGGQTIAGYDATALDHIPLFVRSGAIIPLAVSDDVTGLGTLASAGKLTVLVYPDAAKSEFKLHDEDDAITTISAVRGAAGGSSVITLTRALRDTVLRVRAEGAVTSVDLGGAPLPQSLTHAALDAAPSGWFVDTPARFVWVKLTKSASAQNITVHEGP